MPVFREGEVLSFSATQRAPNRVLFLRGGEGAYSRSFPPKSAKDFGNKFESLSSPNRVAFRIYKNVIYKIFLQSLIDKK